MQEAQLASINALVNEIYDDVDSLSEELVDDNPKEANRFIDELLKKLKHLKSNITHDEV